MTKQIPTFSHWEDRPRQPHAVKPSSSGAAPLRYLEQPCRLPESPAAALPPTDEPAITMAAVLAAASPPQNRSTWKTRPTAIFGKDSAARLAKASASEAALAYLTCLALVGRRSKQRPAKEATDRLANAWAAARGFRHNAILDFSHWPARSSTAVAAADMQKRAARSARGGFQYVEHETGRTMGDGATVDPDRFARKG